MAVTALHPRTDRLLSSRIREAGIVGAGGAGFPTYVKYAKPTPLLVVNGAESEPGYYGDKLLFRDRAEEFARLFVYLKDIEGYDRILVGVEELAKPYMAPLERLADATEAFEVLYFPNVYKYGQERALVKVLLQREVPTKGIPPDVGVTVNNNETLWNVYRALFEGKPVTTKFLSVFGETPRHVTIEAPIGAFAADLVQLAGGALDPALHLYDGGPVLCDEVADWTRQPYGIGKATNGLLLVAPERRKTRAKSYPRPDGPPHPDRIEDVTSRIRRVRVPLAGNFGVPARAVVHVGEEVDVDQPVGEAAKGKLSVPAHASIPGTVVAVNDAFVEIER